MFSLEDLEGLIPSHFSTRSQLDAHEHANILQARLWALRSRKLRRELITFQGLLLLHKRMFEDTWEWAGKLRRTATNIGVEPSCISSELAQLVGDISYWTEHETFPAQEIAVRFHHKLVWIHPFPNGNGRHARLAADLFLFYRGEQELTWGGARLTDPTETRRRYISALRRADRFEFADLMTFATS